MTRQLDSSALPKRRYNFSWLLLRMLFAIGTYYARLIPWAAGRRRARWHAQLSRRRRRRRWQPPRQQDRMCRPWCTPCVPSCSRDHARPCCRDAALASAAANNSDNALAPTDTAPRSAVAFASMMEPRSNQTAPMENR